MFNSFVVSGSEEETIVKETSVDLSDKSAKTVEEYINEHKSDLKSKITGSAKNNTSQQFSDYLTTKNLEISEAQLSVMNSFDGKGLLRIKLSYKDNSKTPIWVEYEIDGFKKITSYEEAKFEKLLSSVKVANNNNNYYSEIVKDLKKFIKVKYTNPDTNSEEDFTVENLKKLNISQLDLEWNPYFITKNNLTNQITVNIKYKQNGETKVKQINHQFLKGFFEDHKKEFANEVRARLADGFIPSEVTRDDLIYDKAKLNNPSTTNPIYELIDIGIVASANEYLRNLLESQGKVIVRYTYKNKETNQMHDFLDTLSNGKKFTTNWSMLMKLARVKKLFTVDESNSSYLPMTVLFKEQLNKPNVKSIEINYNSDSKKFMFLSAGLEFDFLKFSEKALKVISKDNLETHLRGHKTINNYKKNMSIAFNKNGKLSLFFSVGENSTRYNKNVENFELELE
ncbi:hypothetical protein NPA07_02475 [Mycoplasmopsis caviae]|uniref:Lipoprotein-associated type-17 domain-containing protein n=2 Tax=Mycoplasmopsis caviae TaxID=55603 RepID=A0A3P8KA10_9BACT|nr:hypothetical protein [Mycoplasmopsis caviae]UUD35717.1 hypothetical protein NPA07_02475 [Mycoplasmopsis caviae]VDR41544.1 Uncharacterised protein [Mycoplasmopsis caviae]